MPLVGIDEAHGGSGGSLADLAVLVRALGRHAISTPLIESSVANWVVTGSGGEAGPGLRTISTHGLDAVGWARHADHLVRYRDDLALLTDLRASGVAVEPGTNVAGEPSDDVRLDAAGTGTLGGAPSGRDVAVRLGLLRAAALTGAVEGAYELTRGYVSTREQFGAPLVRIPAVASNLAIMKAAAIQCDAALARAVAGTARDPEAGTDAVLTPLTTLAGRGRGGPDRRRTRRHPGRPHRAPVARRDRHHRRVLTAPLHQAPMGLARRRHLRARLVGAARRAGRGRRRNGVLGEPDRLEADRRAALRPKIWSPVPQDGLPWRPHGGGLCPVWLATPSPSRAVESITLPTGSPDEVPTAISRGPR